MGLQKALHFSLIVSKTECRSRIADSDYGEEEDHIYQHVYGVDEAEIFGCTYVINCLVARSLSQWITSTMKIGQPCLRLS